MGRKNKENNKPNTLPAKSCDHRNAEAIVKASAIGLLSFMKYFFFFFFFFFIFYFFFLFFLFNFRLMPFID